MFFVIVLFLLFLKSLTSSSSGVHEFVVEGQYTNVSTATKYNCFENERKALLLFKAGVEVTSFPLNGLSSWSCHKEYNINCCEWHRVECSHQTGHVIKLNLNGTCFDTPTKLLTFCLKGKISSSLLKLRHLNYLDLSGNNFQYQSIPHFIGYLTELKHLDLSNSGLVGTIPSPQHGNHLDMQNRTQSENSSSIEIGGIPKSFRNLCSLQSLYLSKCSISGNLSDIFHILSSCADITLENLYLDDNKLTGSLPDSIGRFSSLKDLNLASNQLNGTVSENIGKLSNLKLLNLAYNSLQGVFPEAHLSNLVNLSFLDLSFNSLSFKVSSPRIPRFQLIHIGLNSIKIGPLFPVWIQNQITLSYLDIGNCGISDDLPTNFLDQLKVLTYINLSKNQIRGKVPDFYSDPMLGNAVIDLSSNLFEGRLPLFPSNSRILNLSGNKFSGSLSSLCQVIDRKLLVLDLSRNLLTGSLPDCLMQFEDLIVLNLAHNQLLGKLSTSIESLHKLETLNLYDNNFFGELPLSLINCKRLKFLDLGANNFSGNVPSGLGENMKSLYALSLRSNNFSGIIPSQLCYLTDLQILDLSWNNFVGRIPQCLKNLKAMVKVNSSREVSSHIIIEVSFHVNDFDDYGEIQITIKDPDTIVYFSPYLDYAAVEWQGKEAEFEKLLGLLKIIDLSNNQLTGEIPNAITSLRGLVVLDLSSNKLQGRIPKEIGQLKSVLSLNFSRNEFSGEIPVSLSMLSLLTNLDLSYNRFSGRIPTSTQLQSFNASSYVGNSGLCGLPLPLKCSGYKLPPTTVDNGFSKQEDKDEFWKWFYIGTTPGFITGFWGVCGALVFNRSCRHAFFRFLDNSKDWVYVKMAIYIARLQR